MNKVFRNFFSYPVAIPIGGLAIVILVMQILQAPSVQPFGNHPWVDEIISPALKPGVVYTQSLEVPAGLAGETFRLALFFGREAGPSSGDVQVSLSQGKHEQVHIALGVTTELIVRKRFQFSGFAAGPAVLTVKGMAGNSETAPGILYYKSAGASLLQGPGIPDNTTASVDWFKIIEGHQKMSLSFPYKIASYLWLLPFMGFFILAWGGIGQAERE